MPEQPNRPTPTIEDYLGVIYVLERDHEPIFGARLAELLQVSSPTVTITLNRMKRDGWIQIPDKRQIQLTPQGRQAAMSVVRRHMLTEWMLARILQVPWSEVHREADLLEHSISPDVEERLRNQFDDPQFCPHGNPLPGNEEASNAWLSLPTVAQGSQVIIRRIHEHAEDDPELMRFLEKNGVLPGTLVKVQEVLPINQTITLLIGGSILTLGMAVAGYIFVEPVELVELNEFTATLP